MRILGTTNISYKGAMEWAKSKNATTVFQTNAKLYWDYCNKVGVNPVIAYAQYALESGYGKFGGVLDATYCNPCGLKTTIGGGDYVVTAHKNFKTWKDGIEAHIDHLALYAGANGYPKSNTQDPRHFKYLLGTVKTTDRLVGTWATDPSYNIKLNKIILEIQLFILNSKGQV